MTWARRHAADIGFVLGGALLVASAFLYWVRTGAGSTLRGHDLIDTIASLTRDRSSVLVFVLTLLWYAVPACGAVAWVVVGFGDPLGRSGRAAAVTTIIVTAVIALYFVVKVGTRVGAGVYVSATGALTVALSAVVPQNW